MPSLGEIGAVASGVGSLASGFGLGQDDPNVDYKGAKRGIRWRVRDAKKAGIHPLYALGAPGVGSGILTPGSSRDPGAGIAGAGQALTNYQGYQDSRQDREQIRTHNALSRFYQEQAWQFDLTHKQLSNDYLQEQITASQQSRLAQRANHIPSLFVPYFDNQTGEITYLNNPDANIEMPETVGLGYWGRGRFINEKSYKQNPYNTLPPPPGPYRR